MNNNAILSIAGAKLLHFYYYTHKKGRFRKKPPHILM